MVALEPTDSPAPNSITITSTSSEERFTFWAMRGHALAMITQLLALMRGDHLMPTPAERMAAPLEPAELPPTNLLEKKKSTRLPHR